VKPAGPPVSMTQVGIRNLQEEIKNLTDMMDSSKKKKPPAPAPKPQISENQVQIMGLRQTVRALKARLEKEEHENLYYESLTEDHAHENEELRREVAELRRQAEYSHWISNRGYTHDREGRDGPRRRY
jgi:predicted RNase H-like nuclease (RuvC/YqgF family)